MKWQTSLDSHRCTRPSFPLRGPAGAAPLLGLTAVTGSMFPFVTLFYGIVW